ncbi:universal stress protein [Photobacterium lutimaris]|uniref:Universal stress protein n=1 Tax=Photobacterium lutimaris TaxID=388278 RepID=A0A2T3IQ82_9GAMM|nr:universal stress protein [Photobacterium lutimaris]PSU30508.1 universal stress global response regulator UspA [Photobacterium lutimaris]TDR76072.1 nucleotide-binding universal stress UspA family protein [Photobacterium lutimaris]
MKYKHILVALELTEETNVLIDRAVFLAKLLNADVSFVHIDGTHGEIYPELIDIKKSPEENPLGEPKMAQLRAFETSTDYPIKHFLVGTGDLSNKLQNIIQDNGVELIICGHHHDFWSNIISYSKHLINKSPVDILVVPI